MPQPKQIDWLKASKADIAILYEYSNPIRNRFGWTWEKFFANALKVPFIPGQKYEDNFRKGAIAKSKAAQIADWLEDSHTEIASQLEMAVHAHRLKTGHAGINQWQTLVEQQASSSGIEILPFNPSSLGLVEFATPDPVSEVKLGAKFYFQIQIPAEGYLWGLEGYEDKWYPMALTRGVAKLPVKKGKTNAPSLDNRKEIDPVCENKDLGRHDFVFIFIDKSAGQDLFPDIQIGQPQSAQSLEEMARCLTQMERQNWWLFQCSLMVRA